MDKFLKIGLDEARKSLETGGIPIGAVLVYQGEILGQGHNQRIQKSSPTLHAEMDAIEKAGRQPAFVYQNSTLYTTLAPCPMCSGAIVLYGIPHVMIGENFNFNGALEWLTATGVEYTLMNEEACYQLMSDFIQENPDLWNEDIGE